jgi:hypothetical protein
METQRTATGRRVTEFDRFFQAAFQAVVGTVIESAIVWHEPAPNPIILVRLIEAVAKPFMALWNEHSNTLRLSPLEAILDDEDMEGLRNFILKYGSDLFHARFMSVANIRGILHQGVGAYLEKLAEEPDPLHPILLLDDLDHSLPRERAIRYLHITLQSVMENYEEYKDYNSTTAQSDYGSNLHILVDFLRLKAAYERNAWQYRPLGQAHEVLVRKGQAQAARLWQDLVRHVTQHLARKHQEDLHRLEKTHGNQLGTIKDRLEQAFVRNLDLDRLCACVEPALLEAISGTPGEAYQRLKDELDPHLNHPIGVGLDVPAWIRRVESEVQQARTSRTPFVALNENLFPTPQKTLTMEEFRTQVADWEKAPWDITP